MEFPPWKSILQCQNLFGRLKRESSSTMKMVCLGLNKNIFVLFSEFIFGVSLNKMKVNVVLK